MTRKSRFTVCFAGLFLCAIGLYLNRAHAWQSDNGNTTFKNPVSYADHPDPDIMRVGGDFSVVSTTFVDSPGITGLQSKVMVNRGVIAHCATYLL